MFSHAIKIYLFFFNNKKYIIEDYFSKKMENKTTRAKDYYQANKKKLQKRLQEYYIKHSEYEKAKNKNYNSIRTKNM